MTEEEQSTPAALAHVNSIASVGTVYADLCAFASTSSSTVRMTFAEFIVAPADGPEPGTKIRHIGHLVMPHEGFDNMVDYLIRARKIMRGEALDGTAE